MTAKEKVGKIVRKQKKSVIAILFRSIIYLIIRIIRIIVLIIWN